MGKTNIDTTHNIRFKKTPRRSTSIEIDMVSEIDNQPDTELNTHSKSKPPRFKHQDSLNVSTNSFLKDGLTITYDLHNEIT